MLKEQEVKRYFDIWRETINRSRLPITTIIIKLVTAVDESEEQYRNIQMQVSDFLQSKIRKTDLLFQLEDDEHWGIFLLQSSGTEAKAFLDRIFSNLMEEPVRMMELKAVITEIRNNTAEFEAIMNKSKLRLADSEQSSWSTYEIEDYSAQPNEVVKVSIIEHNDIFRYVLETTLKQLDLPNFTFEITTYEDGYLFLESDHYKTGHMHFILMNDILPRKNGFEILHHLRKMPNAKKFIIYMMSERNYEGAMLQAYEGGVDEYIVKPFNLRLLEAKIKRTFARFWL